MNDCTSPAPAAGAAPAPAAPRPRRWRRCWRWLWRALLALPVLLALALGGLWLWAGAEGSLATALGWLARVQPLQAEGVRGSLRAGGQADKLLWQQGGLRVQVEGAALRWRPAALLWQRTLHIESLGAARIVIDDQSPPASPPASGPPADIALPLPVRVDALRAGELHWAGPPAQTVRAVAGRYAFDGRQHALTLAQAAWHNGRYRAQASLTAQAPVTLQLALAAALQAPLPGASAALPLTAQATLQGPLDALQLRALAQAAAAASAASAAPAAAAAQGGQMAPAAQAALPAPGASAAAASAAWVPPAASASSAASAAGAAALPDVPPLPGMADALGADLPLASAAASARRHAGAEAPQAHLQARITPWAAQPLPEAHARLRAFDMAALWPQAPRTNLNGTLDLQPLPPSAAASQAGWALQADMANAAPGPWDKGRLPLSHLLADVHWQGGLQGQAQGGLLTVRRLQARAGQGSLQAEGHWAMQAANAAHAGAHAAGSAGQLRAVLTAINPAALHSQLAPLLLDGTASVQAQLAASPARPAAAGSGAGQARGGSAAAGVSADFDIGLQARHPAAPAATDKTADSATHALLQLRQASAKGRWADGLLALPQLQLRTSDAELTGSASLRLLPAATGTAGGKNAAPKNAAPQNAPAQWGGHLGGQADLRLRLPGASASLQGDLYPASGKGQLQASLQDAARALAWARQWPGARQVLASWQASGQATLEGRWQGGWRDPAIDARLSAPHIDLRLPGPTAAPAPAHTAAQAATQAAAQGAPAPGPAAGSAAQDSAPPPGPTASQAPSHPPGQSASQDGSPQAAAPAAPQAASAAPGPPQLRLRQWQASLQGRLAHMQLALQGQASQRSAQGLRQMDVRLAASGGRSSAGPSLAASGWHASLSQLQADVRHPALGDGPWRLALHGGSVSASWSPAQGGQLQVGAGQATLTSPAPVSQALLAWGPLHWRPGGELRSTGRISGLPLQWAERLSGNALADAGVHGSLVLDGGWDLALGQSLRLSAHLARASGDLSLLATDEQTGVQSRVAAGVRAARLDIDSNGPALTARLQWDSERAGVIHGTLGTRLAAGPDDGGTHWHWPATAPLSGQLQARLPQISVWSQLAPPGWRLRGALQADMRLGGTRAQPLLTGTLAADGLALRSVADGFQFQDGRLRARLDGTRLLIDEFLLRGPAPRAQAAGAAATAGSGGLIRASGEAGWIDGRAQAHLNATLQQLRASIRADRQVTVSGQVRATLDGRALQASGRLKADRALIELPDDSAPSLGDDVIVRGPGGKIMYGSQAPGAVSGPQDGPPATARPGAPPFTVKADMQLDLGDNFRLRGMGIDTRLSGVLTLSANGPLSARPRLSGTLHTAGGRFRAYGQQLTIQRGNIVFTGDAANPTLDILALRPNYSSDQRVGAQVQGSALLPRVRLYSSPALSESETLAWLLLGRAAPSTGAEAAMLQSAALALLGGRDGKSLASRFGLDELSFSGGETGDVSNASVTLGKRLSDRLYAAYAHSLAGTGGTLMVFYELSRRWTLRGQAGENAALDLIYRLSFD